MASTATTFDSDCVLMLHMDGADASTTFTDSSFSSTKTVTAAGNAQIDTAQSVFGGASGLFDGANDNLDSVDHADWDLGTGDFTFDFRIRFNAQAGTVSIIDRGTNKDFSIRYNSVADLLEIWLMNSQTNLAWTAANATWYHVAVIRTGTTCRAFVDGTQIGADATKSDNVSATTAIVIANNVAGTQDFDGWLDEFRIVKGTAVWTANFTPPSAAYTRATVNKINKMMLMGVA